MWKKVNNLFRVKKQIALLLAFGIATGIAVIAVFLPFQVFAQSSHSDAINTTNIPGFNFPKIIPDANPPLILGGGGETFAFVKTGKTTCGQYTMAEAVVPPGGGPPPHIHHHANEWFYFPDGGITLMHGSTLYPEMKDIPGVTAPKERLHLEAVKPGSIYYSPKQYMHGFVNNSTALRRVTFVWTPDDDKVGISNYFLAVGQKILDRSNPPTINPENRARYVSEAPKYEITQSSNFWEYVDSVDYSFPKMDLHLDELQALLAPDGEGGKGRNCQ